MHDFHGTIHLLDEPDQVLDAKVTVDLNRVLVRADGAEIGSWRHADVEVQKSEDGIHMTADGETLVLNMENRDLLLDLLGGTESGGKRRKKRRRKPAPDPAPPAAEVASSQYSAEDAVAEARDLAERIFADADGTRQATLLVPQGTQAELVLPDGSVQAVGSLAIRATEYTVGPKGPERMPAPLHAFSGYTYAVKLSVDEALAAGATRGEFDRPRPWYVEP